MNSNFLKILTQIRKAKILVVGDLILDAYNYGEVARISPEAPVPVFQYKSKSFTAGGSGNCALNIRTIGGKASIAGFVGKDENGKKLIKLLQTAGLDTGTILKSTNITSVKTRLIANHKQQLLRIDEEQTGIKAADSQKLIRILRSKLSGYQAVIFSDYGKGTITEKLFYLINVLCREKNMITIVDPKKENYGLYNNAFSMTPNHIEAAEDCGMPCDTEAQTFKCAGSLIKKYGLDQILITRGAKGMALLEKSGRKAIIPAFTRNVYDVSGAGDTVIALYTAALSIGANAVDAAKFANFGAAVAVSKFGTTPVTSTELKEFISTHKA